MQEKAGGHSASPTAGFGIASALLMAFCITIPAMLILAAILTFTDFPEKYTTIGVLLATLSGLFIAGYKTGTNNEKNGVVKGGLTGLAYMLILYVTSSILLKEFTLNPQAIIMIVSGILAGAIGGLMGTNKKSKPSKRFGGIRKGTDPFKMYRK